MKFIFCNFTDDLCDGKISEAVVKQFQEHIFEYYNLYGRSFAWREEITPYKIVVSEIMLQQTQTERVKKKFLLFMQACASFEELAHASQRTVLQLWQGLGYNRRGLALHTIAKKVVEDYGGILPKDPEVLVNFPGIGKATAASICTFAFNMSIPFIETNIRAVFIHLFFQGRSKVCDKELMPLIEKTLFHEDPRRWYYALMDYGVMLKKHFKNPSRRSKHYTKQSKFEGSDRQIRGMIIKILTKQDSVTYEDLCNLIKREPIRITKALDSLCGDSMIIRNDNVYSI